MVKTPIQERPSCYSLYNFLFILHIYQTDLYTFAFKHELVEVSFINLSPQNTEAKIQLPHASYECPINEFPMLSFASNRSHTPTITGADTAILFDEMNLELKARGTVGISHGCQSSPSKS